MAEQGTGDRPCVCGHPESKHDRFGCHYPGCSCRTFEPPFGRCPLGEAGAQVSSKGGVTEGLGGPSVRLWSPSPLSPPGERQEKAPVTSFFLLFLLSLSFASFSISSFSPNPLPRQGLRSRAGETLLGLPQRSKVKESPPTSREHRSSCLFLSPPWPLFVSPLGDLRRSRALSSGHYESCEKGRRGGARSDFGISIARG